MKNSNKDLVICTLLTSVWRSRTCWKQRSIEEMVVRTNRPFKGEANYGSKYTWHILKGWKVFRNLRIKSSMKWIKPSRMTLFISWKYLQRNTAACLILQLSMPWCAYDFFCKKAFFLLEHGTANNFIPFKWIPRYQINYFGTFLQAILNMF